MKILHNLRTIHSVYHKLRLREDWSPIGPLLAHLASHWSGFNSLPPTELSGFPQYNQDCVIVKFSGVSVFAMSGHNALDNQFQPWIFGLQSRSRACEIFLSTKPVYTEYWPNSFNNQQIPYSVCILLIIILYV